MSTSLSLIILAAGQGKRMHSDRPKVLHELAGKPLLHHLLNTTAELKPDTVHIVYGHKGEIVRQYFEHHPNKTLRWVEQAEQLGTGHAVMQALPHLPQEGRILVVYGDVPLISVATLQKLSNQTPPTEFGLLTAKLNNPYGYGRIVRDAQGRVSRVVEEKEADQTIRAIQEINTGILIAPIPQMRHWLSFLTNNNAQGEYYLTDIIELAVRQGINIHTYQPDDLHEIMGVNNQCQLAELERYYQREQVSRLMLAGVKVYDPSRLEIRGQVNAGRDVTIDVNVILAGRVHLGNRVKIGPHTLIRDTYIADDVEILSHCVIENATIGKDCRIGPFARLRPETQLAQHVHIGNFVEIKKTNVAEYTKINHLSYIGDSEIGRRVNIGAGTITCNYDGVNKHKTVIGDRAFIGSDTQLIAPVTVGIGATIGAGSTITSNTPAEKLTLSRAPQRTIEYWERPAKK